jgi:hypothetical protein
MMFDGHVPVISDDIDMTLFDLSRQKVPRVWILDIRLIDHHPVDQKLPVAEFNQFALHGHHPF